jgi:hypothetical protein
MAFLQMRVRSSCRYPSILLQCDISHHKHDAVIKEDSIMIVRTRL